MTAKFKDGCQARYSFHTSYIVLDSTFECAQDSSVILLSYRWFAKEQRDEADGTAEEDTHEQIGGWVCC
jgi:hypothetical protein